VRHVHPVRAVHPRARRTDPTSWPSTARR
jgi:hypothetical protein